jgi:hypothetical protein
MAKDGQEIAVKLCMHPVSMTSRPVRLVPGDAAEFIPLPD